MFMKIADMESNKKKNSPIVTELSLKCRKLNILLTFLSESQSYFKVPKTLD